ncbi:MAG: metallophosphoesterase [Phycisphaerales bacterium]|nr:metallophosphoesterase [Phycisphaerales bacterium]
MKIQYASDLHLEFLQNKAFLRANPLVIAGEVLVLAGDIIPFAIMDQHKDFFSYIADNFQTTYWVPGNHEYYHSDATTKMGKLFEKIRSNIFLVNNTTVQHGPVNFIFSTLWSKVNPANDLIKFGLTDFHVINYKGTRFSVDQYNELHDTHVHYLKGALQQNGNYKTVVVTHHIPTFLNYAPVYEDGDLSEALGVELSHIIEPSTIDAWIYGHTHCNTPNFTIGNTQMLTNQLGYVRPDKPHTFNSNTMIEIV